MFFKNQLAVAFVHDASISTIAFVYVEVVLQIQIRSFKISLKGTVFLQSFSFVNNRRWGRGGLIDS